MNKTKGIRISDEEENGIIAVHLPHILVEINDADSFYWSILHIYAHEYLRIDQEFLNLVESINDSPKGISVTWEELNMFSKSFHQIFDTTIIGCKDKNLLHRYNDDREMHETCDITIEMIDCGYWEVFSKDDQLITKLASKFKDIKFLESDFEK